MPHLLHENKSHCLTAWVANLRPVEGEMVNQNLVITVQFRYLLKTTSITGSDPSFLTSEVTWHLLLESLMFLHKTLLRNSLINDTKETN